MSATLMKRVAQFLQKKPFALKVITAKDAKIAKDIAKQEITPKHFVSILYPLEFRERGEFTRLGNLGVLGGSFFSV